MTTYARLTIFLSSIVLGAGIIALYPSMTHAMPVAGASTKSMPPIGDAITLTASSSAPTPVSCPSLNRSLSVGMRSVGQNGDVLALQHFFVAHYGERAEDIATGYFGPLTHSLVMRFQKEHNLPQVGIVGPLTRAAIKEACTGSSSLVSISTPEGDEKYVVGDNIPVSWNVSGLPQNAGMYLQLVHEGSEQEVVKSVIVDLHSGSTTLALSEGCNGNFSDAIFGECENLKEILKDAKQNFKVHAVVYTPKDMCFGFCMATTTPTIFHAKAQSASIEIDYPDRGTFTATETTGKAPLTTTFSITRSGEYTLSFGDEKTETVSVPSIVCVRAPCNPMRTVEHTYTKPGTYYAVLTRTIKNECKPTKDTVCAAWVSREETVGSIVIEATKK